MRKKRILLSNGPPRALWLLAAGLGLAGCHRPGPPAAECVLTYGGEAHTLVVQPTSEPYRVSALKVEDTFEFKAVFVASPSSVAALNFYTYFETDRGPVIVEQTKFRPPFPRNSAGSNGNFTGVHYVYGPNGAELVYACHWRAP